MSLLHSSSVYEDDLFKKFKLKHHRTIHRTYEGNAHNDKAIVKPIELLTPDIDELQRQENDLLKCIQSPTVSQQNEFVV